MIIINKDPAGVLGREIYSLKMGYSIQENIENLFPHGLDANTTTLIINGEEVNPLYFDLSRKVTRFDTIHIIKRPQATGVIAAVVAVVAALAVTLLTPKPTIPNNSGEQKESPNNRLTGQTNIARLYQAIPDIYGKVRAYPDLIALSLYEYIDNVKYVTENLCVGIGSYQLDNFKYAETDINTIIGSSYEIFNPGDVIPIFYDAFDSPDIDGQEITPPNLGNQTLYEAITTAINNATMAGGNANFKIVKTADFDHFYNKVKPINANFISDFKYSSVAANGSPTEVQVRLKYSAIIDSIEIVMEDLNEYYNIHLTNVSYQSLVMGGGFGFKYPPDDIYPLTTYFQLIDAGALDIGPFILPVSSDQIWYNVIFPRALKGTAQFTAAWYQIDNNGEEITGTRQSESFNYSADTYESKYYTRKITPAAGFGRYAFTIRRNNNGNDDLTDQAKLEDVFAIRTRYNVIAKDTLIRVTTKATEQATGFKDKKFNVEATRKTISYVDGKINYDLTPSRDFADAVLHTFVSIAGRSQDEIDIESLYKISQSIKSKNEMLGWFDFSFDDKDISLGQRLQTICNAARVTVYRDGLKWRFVREEKKAFPVAQFDARNLANSSDGGTIQWKANLPSSYDGIELEWIDATDTNDDGTDKKSYIRLKIDKTTKRIIESPANRPNKIQLAGCRNKLQAMNRAQLEARRLIYQRVNVEDEALSDANFVQIGDRVMWADVYDESVASGEILAINGNIFTTSEELNIDKNIQYKVSITDRYGNPSGWITANPTTGSNNSFQANFNNAYIADGVNSLVGSRFTLVPAVSKEPIDFTLVNKSPGSSIDVTNISLTQYDDRLFEYDEIA